MISDNNGKVYDPIITKKDKLIKLTIPKEQIGIGKKYIEITDEEFEAKVGDDGYYVIADAAKTGSQLCRFTDKADEEHILKQNLMPIIGVKKNGFTVLIIAVGMKNCFYVRMGVKNGKYELALRTILDGDKPYEDISFEVHILPDTADYNDMAREYRNYQLERGACRPIKERIKNNSALEYAADSVEIRIRMGWKPAPSKVLEQTPENEPEMHVACSFDRIRDIIDELKRQGIDKAQLCLVGWNKSGHDGCWPRMFPVEEKLGGEEKLRELIRYAQDGGYQIVCHTNSTDWYNISEIPKDYVVKDANGEYSSWDNFAWSGGRMYNLCPIKAYDIAKQELPRVAELGFSGLHYIDVISVVPLRRCYDEKHPVNENETEKLYQKIGALSHDLFGGFASEGAFDFAAPYLDYALYTAFSENTDNLFDEEIPLWQLVYHGIILSNPSTATVNYTLKDDSSRKKLMAYGGRPIFYFYSRFLEGSNQDEWLGKEDMCCDTDEQLKYSVSKIKEAYDEYKKYRHLQKEFIEHFRYVNNGETETVYSDGTVLKI